MQEIRSVKDRVIVGFERMTPGRNMIKKRVMSLAREIKPAGVIGKLESFLHTYGFGLADGLRRLKTRHFADLKMIGNRETLKKYVPLIAEMRPEFVTVMCETGTEAMRVIVEALPYTDVVAIPILSSISEREVITTHATSVDRLVIRRATAAARAGIKEFVCRPSHIGLLRQEFGIKVKLNVVGIRLPDTKVKNDDQESTMTPGEVIIAGGDRVIIERPVVDSVDPYDTVMRVIEDIDKAIHS